MSLKFSIHEFDLQLRHPFTISRETITSQRTVVVELENSGHHGFGEATSNSYYGFSQERICEALESVREQVESWTLDDPIALWTKLQPRLKENPFAQCALDQAAHDLWGKKLGRPVHALWGLNTDRSPPTDYTIGIDEIDVMIAKMNEYPDWPVYKIKLGTKHDLEIVAALRKQTSSPFRVDANCGWTAEETIRNSRELKGMDVEFIEQPLPADQWEGMIDVYQRSALPVIADESCIAEEDIARCAGHFHGVNIKLTKCGGLTPARRMIERASQLGMQVMVGCMTESTVGISAIAQLLPSLDYVDMDGAMLLSKDIASGVTIENGRCIYPEENGNGVTLLSR